MKDIINKHKFLFFLDSLKPAGGVERVVTNLANSLCRAGFEIIIIVKDSGENFYPLESQVRVVPLNSGFSLNMNNRHIRLIQLLWSFLRTLSSLRGALKRYGYEVIYVTHPRNMFEVFVAQLFYLKNVIVSEHGAVDGYNKIYKKIKDIFYPSVASYVLPINEEMGEYIKAGFPAVCIPHFRPPLKYVESNLENKVVLNIGRFTPDKQQLVLLEMWKRVASKFPDWKLQIIGSGELSGEIGGFLKRNHLNGSVDIINPVKDISEFYKQASVFCLTSRFEGFGMVLLEASSFGLPSIAFDCPSGPKEIIKNGQTGFLVKLNDTDEYLKHLESLIENKSLRLKIGHAAFNHAQSWNEDEITTKWKQLIMNVKDRVTS